MKRIVIALAAVALAVLTAAGCSSKTAGSHPDASAVAGSIAANPTASADAAQAEAIVKSCFTGTPLQQVHTIHLVFLSKASGKNGPAVTAARAQVFGCLGVPAANRTAFKNDAITAAEHGKVYTKAGAKTYLAVTLPQLVAKYRQTTGPTTGTGDQGAPSPSPAVTGAGS